MPFTRYAGAFDAEQVADMIRALALALEKAGVQPSEADTAILKDKVALAIVAIMTEGDRGVEELAEMALARLRMLSGAAPHEA